MAMSMIWRCGGDVDDEDNYRVAANSPAQTPLPMQRLLNPVGYSQHHDLAHVAVDHERYSCNSLIPSGTTNHTQLIAGNSITSNFRGSIKEAALKYFNVV